MGKAIILILFLFATPVFSGTQSLFHTSYLQGKEYYKKFELDKAIEALEKALISIGENEDETSILDAYSILGVSYISQGHIEKAKEYYGKILKTNPSFQLPEDHVSPKVTKVFNEAKAQIQSYSSLVSISSNPPFAKIFIDNEEKGITPLTLELSPNKEYQLALLKEGFKGFHKTFKVSSPKLVINEELMKDTSSFVIQRVSEASPKNPPHSSQVQQVDLLKSFLSQEEEKSWYQEWLPWIGIAALAAGATYAIASSSQKSSVAPVETLPIASGIRITVP